MIKVKDLSNLELILFILRRMQGGWSAGGISVGRSPITVLFEPALWLLVYLDPQKISYGRVEEIEEYELRAEMESRKPTLYPHIPPIFKRKYWYFDRLTLATMLLRSCSIYIDKNSKDEYGPIYYWESKMIKEVVRMLNPYGIKNIPDRRMLILAANDVFDYQNRLEENRDGLRFPFETP